MRFIYSAFNHSTLGYRPLSDRLNFFGSEWLWNNKSSGKVNKHMRAREQCSERDFAFCFLARLTKTKEEILHERNSNGSIKRIEFLCYLVERHYPRNNAAEASYITRDQHSNILRLFCAIWLRTSHTKLRWNKCFAENKSIYMMKRHRSRINRWRETSILKAYF